MAVSSEYAEYIFEKLEVCIPQVEKNRFFGGIGFKSNNLQFGMIMKNILYLCVDNESRAEYKQKNSIPFSYMTKKGRIFVEKYYTLPDDILENQELFCQWCERALHAAAKKK